MKKTKEIKSGGIYILRGLAAANSFEFENESEAVIHLELFNSYMRKYVKLISYSLTPHGWEYMVQIRDSRTIKKHILDDSNAKARESWNITRIIGERIRVFRLVLRKKLNLNQGRKGSGVRNTFEKFYFETTEEMRSYFEKMENKEIDLSQPVEEYRPDEKRYDKDGKLHDSDRYDISILSTKAYRILGRKWFFLIHKISLKVLDLLVDLDDILNKKPTNNILTDNSSYST